MIALVDEISIIACAITNMQPQLVKILKMWQLKQFILRQRIRLSSCLEKFHSLFSTGGIKLLSCLEKKLLHNLSDCNTAISYLGNILFIYVIGAGGIKLFCSLFWKKIYLTSFTHGPIVVFSLWFLLTIKRLFL